MTSDWAVFQSFLPEGWQSQARHLGAFCRRRRIDSPEALLKLLLGYVTSGLSLSMTALCAESAQVTQHLSATALEKRLRRSRPWLCWMVRNLLAESAPPSFALSGPRTFRVCDGTQVRHGKRRYRIHYSLTLPDGCCDWFECVEWKGQKSGESFRHWGARPYDIFLGDRGYGYRSGVACVLLQGADVLVRIHPDTFPMLNSRLEPFDPLEWVKSFGPAETKEQQVFFTHGGKRFGPLRLVARPVEAKTAEKAAKRARGNSRGKGRRSQQRTQEAAKWLFLVTSLESEQLSARGVEEVFRCRWQVELGIKRIKSTLGIGQLPLLEEESALAWLEAKLLLCVVGEKMREVMGAFSPSGQGETGSSQLLERAEAGSGLTSGGAVVGDVAGAVA